MKRVPVTLVFSMLVCALACGRPITTSEASASATRTAPEFALEDLSGKVVRLSDSAGQVRLVDFWATWCPPCREEIPSFKELHRDYGEKGLKILAISMDDDAKKVLPPFLAKWEVPYTNLIGTEEVAQSFPGVVGLPTTFLIDREGRIIETFVGGTPKHEMEAQVRKLLGLEPAG